MTFSEDSDIQVLKGETLAQKIGNLDYRHWGANTNLELAFDKILDIAIKHNVPKDQMVKSLVIISDMEIDAASHSDMKFLDVMEMRYANHGYKLPNIVFWNVESRNNVFHADMNRKRVQLCSGHSTSTFKQLIKSIGKTPIEMMLETINDERYSPITIKE